MQVEGVLALVTLALPLAAPVGATGQSDDLAAFGPPHSGDEPALSWVVSAPIAAAAKDFLT